GEHSLITGPCFGEPPPPERLVGCRQLRGEQAAAPHTSDDPAPTLGRHSRPHDRGRRPQCNRGGGLPDCAPLGFDPLHVLPAACLDLIRTWVPIDGAQWLYF